MSLISKITNKYINKTDLFVIFLFFIFMIHFFNFFEIHQKKSDELILIIHTSILTSLIMIFIFIEKEWKDISQLSIFFSIMCLPSIFIIENFSIINRDVINEQINYSIFSFYRSMYYYFLIKTICIYFNKKNDKILVNIYFIFVLSRVSQKI